MPCSDTQAADERRERLNAATRVACELAKTLEEVITRHGEKVQITLETYKWVEEHKKMDKEREEREEQAWRKGSR